MITILGIEILLENSKIKVISLNKMVLKEEYKLFHSCWSMYAKYQFNAQLRINYKEN